MMPRDLISDFKGRSFPWNFWYFFIDLPKQIKWFFQRGWRGWADADIWSFDWYLSRVITSGLKHFKKNLHGHPPDITSEEWEKILQKIIDGFQAWIEVQEFDSLDTIKLDKLVRKASTGRKLFSKWFGNLWD